MSYTMPDEPTEPIATVEYELTDEIACQAALDSLDRHMLLHRDRLAEWGKISPVIILLGAALQILIGIAAVIYFGGWHLMVAKVLIAVGLLVVVILLWKAAFYGIPPLARWYMCAQTRRHTRSLTHRRICWRLYEDRLETESASMHRRMAWTEIARMTPCGQSIVLSLTSRVELFIPASVLTPKVQSLITERISARRTVDDLPS